MQMDEITSEWVKAARAKAGLTLEQLGDLVGRTKSNVAQWEKGKHSPSYAQMLALSKVTGHPLPLGADLVFDDPHNLGEALPGSELSASQSTSTSARRIYVVGTIDQQMPEEVWADPSKPTGATDEYAVLATDDPRAFLIAADDAQMAPRYYPGEFALVEPGNEPDLEDDVLVRLATGHIMIKRLLSRRGGWRFGSYNNSEVLFYKAEEVSWVYCIAHPVPRRKIKARL